jgi:Cu/Ag efflux pump CusA
VVRLQGANFAHLNQVAERLGKRLRDVRGIVDVDHFPRMGEVVTVDIDREKAGLSGVTVRDVVD